MEIKSISVKDFLEKMYNLWGVNLKSMPFAEYFEKASALKDKAGIYSSKFPLEYILLPAASESKMLPLIVAYGWKYVMDAYIAAKKTKNVEQMRAIESNLRLLNANLSSDTTFAVGFFQLMCFGPSMTTRLRNMIRDVNSRFGKTSVLDAADLYQSSLLEQTKFLMAMHALAARTELWSSVYAPVFFNALGGAFAIIPEGMASTEPGTINKPVGLNLNDGNFFHYANGKPYAGYVKLSNGNILFQNPSLTIGDWAWAIYTNIQYIAASNFKCLVNVPPPSNDAARQDLAIRIALGPKGDPNKTVEGSSSWSWQSFARLGLAYRGDLKIIEVSSSELDQVKPQLPAAGSPVGSIYLESVDPDSIAMRNQLNKGIIDMQIS